MPPFILGWDVAGTVEAMGYGVTRFEIGDAVYGMPRFPRAAGAYARAARERMRVNQLELSIRWLVRALDLADVERRPADELGGWLRALGDAGEFSFASVPDEVQIRVTLGELSPRTFPLRKLVGILHLMKF